MTDQEFFKKRVLELLEEYTEEVMNEIDCYWDQYGSLDEAVANFGNFLENRQTE